MLILYACALAPLIPVVSAALLPVVSKFSVKARDYFSVIVASSTLLLTLLMIPRVFSAGHFVIRYHWISWIGVDAVVVTDALSIVMANIASFIGLLTVLYSLEYMKDETGLTRYYSFVLLFIGSMIGLVLSGNLLLLYLFWELVSVCSFFLIGFRYKDPSAVKAATKAFLVTRLGSVCLLVGMLWMYNYTLTFDITALGGLVHRVPFAILQACSFLFLLGAMSKSAQLPFHMWLPDAMEAPTPVSALIHAATMVNAGIYLVARVSPLFSSVPAFSTTMMYIGIFTALFAATQATATNDIKRLLAYSTISQLGYVMFILGMKPSLAYFAGVFHMLNHALFKALLFLCAGAVIHAVGTRDMDQMGGLWRKMPVTFIMSVGGAMALAGLPPFNGFFSKELIFEAAEIAGHPYLLAIAAATSALTFSYSLKFVYKVFLGSRRRSLCASKTPLLMTICLRVLGVTCILSVLTEESLISLFSKSGLISVSNSVTPYGGLQPVPLVSSMGALALGFSAFLLRKQIVKFITDRGLISQFVSFIKTGYGFNQLTDTLSRLSISTALVLSKKRYPDRLYNALGRVTMIGASRARRIQTGILGWNMKMVVVGILSVIFFIILLH